MAKTVASVFTNAMQTLIADGVGKLTGQQLLNTKCRLIPETLENGVIEYKVQRSKRIKGKTLNQTTATGNPTKGLGDSFVELANSASSYDWETVATKTGQKQVISIRSQQTDLGKIQSELDSGGFDRVAASETKTALVDNDEKIVAELKNAGTDVTPTSKITSDEILFDTLVNAQVEVSTHVDDFVAYTDDEDIITLVNPVVEKLLVKFQGRGFMPNAGLMNSGYSNDFSIMGRPCYKCPVLNTLGDDPTNPTKVVAFITYARDSLVAADPLATQRIFGPQQLGDETWLGFSWHNLIKAIDPARIKIAYVDATKVSKTINA